MVPAPSQTVRPPRAARPPRAVAALDGALDGVVVAFALWTLWYEIALVAHLGLWLPAAVWMGLVVVAVAAGAWRGWSRTERPAPADASVSPATVDAGGAVGVLPGPAARGRRVRPALLALAAVLLVGAVAARSDLGVLPVALVGLVVLGAQLLARLRARPSRPDEAATSTPAEIPVHAHWVALAVSLGFAGLASVLLNPNGDDVYYVNRSTWVAARGFASLRDTMFGPETFPSTYGGGLPMTSFEPLVGALAHVVHLQAGTFCYLLVPPVGGFLAGWATWRLVRSWAPRGALLVFLVAAGFTLLSGDSLLGNFSLGRMWQGKVLAYCVLVPLIWCYLSVLVERRSRLALLMLSAAGVCYVGLVSSAALMAPVIAAAAVLAALVLRSRRLALGALALVVGPVLSGVTIALWPAAVGGIDPTAPSAGEAFTKVLGTSAPIIVVSLLGLVLGVRRARGRMAVLAACGSVAMLVALLPGVLDLVNVTTAAGPVAWRLLVSVPVGVVVGLMAVPPAAGPAAVGAAGAGTQRWRPRTHAALVAVAVAALLVAGTPIWSHEVGARLTSSPTWKVTRKALDDVRAVRGLRTGPGPWLLPQDRMSVLSIGFVRPAALVPRKIYLVGVRESRADASARRVLSRLGHDDRPLPDRSKVVGALRRLDVALVCVPRHLKARTAYVDAITVGPLREAGRLSCGRPPG